MSRQCGEVDVWVGRTLASLRQQRGLSQSALAKSLGLSFQQVQKYEGGQNRLSAGRLFELATVLECSIGDFFPQSATTYGPSAAVSMTAEDRALSQNFTRIQDKTLRRSVAHIVEALAQT